MMTYERVKPSGDNCLFTISKLPTFWMTSRPYAWSRCNRSEVKERRIVGGQKRDWLHKKRH